MPEDFSKTNNAITKPSTHVSEHLANERTYLAYLRTSVSLMGFGIAINRFSLYLIQTRDEPAARRIGSTLVGAEQMGIGMLFLGIALLLWAAFHYRTLTFQIDAETFRPQSRDIWITTALVMCFALAGSAWLVFK